jgi:hypothetical protein
VRARALRREREREREKEKEKGKERGSWRRSSRWCAPTVRNLFLAAPRSGTRHLSSFHAAPLEIKKRLAGVTALLDALKTDRDPLTSDSDFLTALLADVAPCLRENNFKVAMTSLEIIELLLARVADTAVRAQFKAIWNGLVECLGDSKLQVREKAVDVVVRLAQILGVSVLFDRLRPCIAHKNWRTREQVRRRTAFALANVGGL